MIEEQVPSFLFATPRTAVPEDDPATVCPVCHRNDTIARASSIARTGRGRLLLEDGSEAEFESELSALLGEPEKPRPLPLLGVAVAVLVSLAVLGAGLLIVAVLRLQDFVSIPDASLGVAKWLAIAWFGVLVPLVTIGRYVGSIDSARRNLEPWRESILRWRDAYYCSRDDVVFLASSAHEPVPPEDAASLWAIEECEPPLRRPVAGIAATTVRTEEAE